MNYSTRQNHQPSTANVLYSRVLSPGNVGPVPNARLHGLGTLLRLLRVVQPQALEHSRHGTRPVLHIVAAERGSDKVGAAWLVAGSMVGTLPGESPSAR